MLGLLPSVHCLLLFLALVSLPNLVTAAVVDFEGFADSTVLTTQIPGLIFSNTEVWKAQQSLNELEFPPHSGANAGVDAVGPITIVFDVAQTSVGGFFTYAAPLSFVAFDTGGFPVGTDTSDSPSNLALSGSGSPNEFLGVTSSGGIRKVTITGDSTGSSFAFDDLTFTPSAPTQVPGPGTAALMAAIILPWLLRAGVGRWNNATKCR